MSMRSIVLVAVVAILILGFVAWRQNTKPAQPAGDSSAQQSMPPDAGGGAPSGMPGGIADQASDPGVTWTTPPKWLTQITSGMRIATYIVPGAGSGQDGECAVYYFGSGKGGGVTPNLERWVSEFSKLEKHDMRTIQVGEFKISEIEVHGTYAEHGMQVGQETAPHEHWALLGAIAEGPTGDVFFKLTGPSTTVSGAAKDFEAMLRTMKKK